MRLLSSAIVSMLAIAPFVGCSGRTSSTTTTATTSGDVGTAPVTPPPCCCQQDPTLSCAGSAYGMTCPRGASPYGTSTPYGAAANGSDTYIVCSDPAPSGDSDSYCCIDEYSYMCAPDPLVPGCPYPSLGFSCQPGSDPTYDYSTLGCSGAGTDPASGYSLFCCQDGVPQQYDAGPTGVTCNVVYTLPCGPGTLDVDCQPSDDPLALLGTYGCSAPAPQANGTVGYCCAPLSSVSKCKSTTTVAGCAYPSIGYTCAGTDRPDAISPKLLCSQGVADPSIKGNTEYCCQ
jgi:hypothetical protein